MMIGLRAQAGLLFVEADSEFTFSGGPKYQSDEVGNEPTEPSRDSLRVKPEPNTDLSSSDSPQTPVGQRFLRAAQR